MICPKSRATPAQSLQQKRDHHFWLLSCFGFFPFLAEGSFFSECFTFFKSQSILFLNPLKITILGAQVTSAKRILCHKTAITIKAWKNPWFHGFWSQNWSVPNPTSSPGRGEGAGRRMQPLLSRESSGGLFGTDATTTALSQGALS